MLSAATPPAALGPCFGTVKHVIRLEEGKKKKKFDSQSERGGSAIGVRMTSLVWSPSTRLVRAVTALRMFGTTIRGT